MSRTRSTALELLVIILLGSLNSFYGIPTLVLGPGTVHARCFRQCPVISDNGLKPSSYPWCSPSSFRAHILSANPNSFSRQPWKPLWFSRLTYSHTYSSFPRILSETLGSAIAMISGTTRRGLTYVFSTTMNLLTMFGIGYLNVLQIL